MLGRRKRYFGDRYNGSRKQKGFCVDNACKNDNDERERRAGI